MTTTSCSMPPQHAARSLRSPRQIALALVVAASGLCGGLSQAVAADVAVAGNAMYCEGNVTWFAVSANGELSVKLDGIQQAILSETTYQDLASTVSVTPRLCDLDTTLTWGVGTTATSIAPQACSGMLSTVTAAKLSGRRVRIKYIASDTRLSCETVGSYSSALMPAYVKLI